ncbi:MAG: DUF6544 family protein [Bdellovibrionales bacterium]
MKIIFVVALIVVMILGGLRFWDELADRHEWNRLRAFQPTTPGRYDPQMVAHLPEPAQRYFNFVIKPGAPLLTVAEIVMEGEFSLGTKEQPNYQSMKAEQILATPEGFVWSLRLPGWVPVSGSDSGLWTRFRILGLIPVARLGGDEDHRRSAFGRYVAEAVFWTPAALLPSPTVAWEKVDAQTARVTVSHTGLRQSVDVEVDPSGKPLRVHFLRWSNANPQKVFREQPFGGFLSNFQEVQGFRIPFQVEAGNLFGTPEYFAFFKAKLKSVRFPEATSSLEK